MIKSQEKSIEREREEKKMPPPVKKNKDARFNNFWGEICPELVFVSNLPLNSTVPSSSMSDR